MTRVLSWVAECVTRWRTGRSTPPEPEVPRLVEVPVDGTLTALEQRVLECFLEGSEPWRVILREQLPHLTVTCRELSGVGFFTTVRIAPEAPRLTGETFLPDHYGLVSLEAPELRSGAGFILWLADGSLHMLEGFTFEGPWTEPKGDFTLQHNFRDQ